MAEGDRAVVTRNVASLRAEPSDRSERVSQTLHGHTVALLEASGEHVRVRTSDGYEGWVQASALRRLTPGEAYAAAARHVVTRPLVGVRSAPRGRLAAPYLLSAGSLVEGCGAVTLADGVRVRIAPTALRPAQWAEPPAVGQILATARRFLGVPYLWGGGSGFGLDCSGFVQLVFSLHGLDLPRDACLQAASGHLERRPMEAPAAGDLLFFGPSAPGDGRRITHVAISLGRGAMIHASGRLGVAVSLEGDEAWRSLRQVARPRFRRG